MDRWHKVRGRKGAEERRQSTRKAEGQIWTEDHVYTFLSTFKTKLCERLDGHDPRLCRNFHNVADKRRNPYTDNYDIDEHQNMFEKMYHPVIFKTSLCHNVPCAFGSQCAHAHSIAEQRDTNAAMQMCMANSTFPQRELSQLATFMPARPEVASRAVEYNQLLLSLQSELRIPVIESMLRLSDRQEFQLSRSVPFFREIEELAFENGLCVVEKCNPRMLKVRGIQVPDTIARISSTFDGLAEDHLSLRLAHTKISASNNVRIEVKEESITVLAVVAQTKTAAAQLVNQVFDKIDFWIEQEEYNKFVECSCCMDRRNFDQGVSCENGHFFCAVDKSQEDCLAVAISSQINNIGFQDGKVICPTCSSPYSIQDIAPHVPGDIFKLVESAVIDRKVKSREELLARDFDQRLDAKVQELMDQYGSVDALLKLEAEKNARLARNTVLNLCCPHCAIVYFEFVGCMALSCESCKGSFCAYCHQKCGSSQGAHEHVRQCLLNDSPTGSYYANDTEIRSAQRRYRTRELKKFLNKFKKKQQNAIVIELTTDLNDLGIKPEALFEFGNLQGEIM